MYIYTYVKKAANLDIILHCGALSFSPFKILWKENDVLDFLLWHWPNCNTKGSERMQKPFSELCGSRKYPDPHHGGNWKFQGGGGVRGPGNSKREGGWTIKSLSRGAISFRFRPEFEHCFLPTVMYDQTTPCWV